jgi:plasmid stabilization system protein ParE
VATRARRVVWAESAQKALDEIIADIATDSDSGAVRVLTVALETAESLSTLAERGRMVPEVGDPTLRELFVFDYRLLYRQDRASIDSGDVGGVSHVSGKREAANCRY